MEVSHLPALVAELSRDERAGHASRKGLVIEIECQEDGEGRGRLETRHPRVTAARQGGKGGSHLLHLSCS